MLFKEMNYRHAFTGGLDSTYVVYKLIKEQPHQRHDLVYINLYSQLYSFEMRIAYLQYKLLKETFPETDIRWCTIESVLPGINMPAGEKVAMPLSQQINVVTTLAADAAEQAARCVGVLHTCGWHKSDTIESSMELGDWSENDYQKMRAIYTDIVCYYDRGRAHQLLTPAWNVDKRVMWDSLPQELRRLVFSSNAICRSYVKEGKQYVIPKDFKFEEYYNKHGIDVAAIFIIEDYKDSDTCDNLQESTLTRERLIAIPFSEKKASWPDMEE